MFAKLCECTTSHNPFWGQSSYFQPSLSPILRVACWLGTAQTAVLHTTANKIPMIKKKTYTFPFDQFRSSEIIPNTEASPWAWKNWKEHGKESLSSTDAGHCKRSNCGRWMSLVIASVFCHVYFFQKLFPYFSEALFTELIHRGTILEHDVAQPSGTLAKNRHINQQNNQQKCINMGA